MLIYIFIIIVAFIVPLSSEAATITIGNTATSSTSDSGNGSPSILGAESVTLSQSATINSLSIYILTAGGNLRLGVYDNTGNLVATATEFTPTTGWNTVNVVTPVLLTAGTYWLAALNNNNAMAYADVDGTSLHYYTYTYGALPSTFSSSNTLVNGTEWAYYATLTTGSNATASISGAGSSGGSGSLTPSTSGSAAALSLPSNGSAGSSGSLSAVSAGNVSWDVWFKWDPSGGATGYKVYYGPDFTYTGTGAQEGNSPIDVGNVTSVIHHGFTGASHFFYVTAYNASAESLPSTVTFLKKETVKKTNIRLSFQ